MPAQRHALIGTSPRLGKGKPIHRAGASKRGAGVKTTSDRRNRAGRRGQEMAGAAQGMRWPASLYREGPAAGKAQAPGAWRGPAAELTMGALGGQVARRLSLSANESPRRPNCGPSRRWCPPAPVPCRASRCRCRRRAFAPCRGASAARSRRRRCRPPRPAPTPRPRKSRPRKRRRRTDLLEWAGRRKPARPRAGHSGAGGPLVGRPSFRSSGSTTLRMHSGQMPWLNCTSAWWLMYVSTCCQ